MLLTYFTKMAIGFLLLLSKQGKVRLAKWYDNYSEKEKQRLVREITALIPLRKPKMCNVLEIEDQKLVYRRYASLFFIAGINSTENELHTLEVIQRYVEIMDKAYGNVCELDIVFNFQLAYAVLDELIIDGVLIESSGGEVLKRVRQIEQVENDERIKAGL